MPTPINNHEVGRVNLRRRRQTPNADLSDEASTHIWSRKYIIWTAGTLAKSERRTPNGI
jgi:hypothetical protein